LQLQVISDLDPCAGGFGGKRDGTAEAVSPSLSTIPTQVFDPSRSQSQSDGIATQTFDPTNSRQSNSQIDFLATQVFSAVSTTHENSGGSPSQNSALSNSQAELATQVFGPVTTMQRKSDGSPGSKYHPSDSQTDLLPTQAFVYPASVAAMRRKSGDSPHQPTQAFSTANPQQRTSSGVGRDGSRISFSPRCHSTQDALGDGDFPHLALEMSECSETHDERSSSAAAEAQVTSLQQVYLFRYTTTVSGQNWWVS